MISPCIGMCTLDPDSGRCVGCSRTLEEIAGWATLAPEERARIMDRLRSCDQASPEGRS